MTDPTKIMTHEQRMELIMKPLSLINKIPPKIHGGYSKPIRTDYKDSELSYK